MITSLESCFIAPNSGTHECLLPALVMPGNEVGCPGCVGRVQGDVWTHVQDQADPPIQGT